MDDNPPQNPQLKTISFLEIGLFEVAFAAVVLNLKAEYYFRGSTDKNGKVKKGEQIATS